MIAVTPDGQRSMSTYLGAASLLEPAHIDPALVQRGAITFLEGYLFDRDEAKAAFVRAAEIARAADRKVALTLSDGFCVERHRDSFIHLIANHIDVLLCNEDEILRLYETADFEAALTRARAECPLVACTRSAKGAVIGQGAEVVSVPAEPVGRIVDTTGAGDQFAAGFLFGVAKGRPLADCGKLGVMAAAEVISHIGPRPIVKLSMLAEQRGL
jgi:sugar/nucleoside kinase (ribokinase family)